MQECTTLPSCENPRHIVQTCRLRPNEGHSVTSCLFDICKVKLEKNIPQLFCGIVVGLPVLWEEIARVKVHDVAPFFHLSLQCVAKLFAKTKRSRLTSKDRHSTGGTSVFEVSSSSEVPSVSLQKYAKHNNSNGPIYTGIAAQTALSKPPRIA